MKKMATIKDIANGSSFDFRFRETNIYKGYQGTNNMELVFSYNADNGGLSMVIHDMLTTTGLSTWIDLKSAKLFAEHGIFYFDQFPNSKVMLDEHTLRFILFPEFRYEHDPIKDVEVASSQLPGGVENYMNESAIAMELHIIRRQANISAVWIMVYVDNYYKVEMLNPHQNL